MNKTWIIAAAEFGMLVRTKAFLVTILLMPVIFAGSILIQLAGAGRVDKDARKVAILDHTGQLYPALVAGAAARGPEETPFVPERVEAGGASLDEVRLEQSQRVRANEIFAFAELPADAFAPAGTGTIGYYSDHPTYSDLRRWIEKTVAETVLAQRMRDAHIDPAVVAGLARPVTAENLGLVARGPDGAVRPAEKVDVVRAFIVPVVLMVILFFTIITTAPQLMNAVIQEKLSKISEVLVGSVSSFELMMGKLLGSAGVSFVLSLVYIGGGLAFAAYSGYASAVGPAQLAYFALFLVLAVLFYGSLFVAIGAACSDIKDAQSLMTPVLVVAMLPIFAWQLMLKSPSSLPAVLLTLFPPATPFMMMLRVAVQPAPPVWQLLLGITLCAASTVGLIWAAGRIFRIGILMQGKSASFGQMIRWLRVK